MIKNVHFWFPMFRTDEKNDSLIFEPLYLSLVKFYDDEGRIKNKYGMNPRIEEIDGNICLATDPTPSQIPRLETYTPSVRLDRIIDAITSPDPREVFQKFLGKVK